MTDTTNHLPSRDPEKQEVKLPLFWLEVSLAWEEGTDTWWQECSGEDVGLECTGPSWFKGGSGWSGE